MSATATHRPICPTISLASHPLQELCVEPFFPNSTRLGKDHDIVLLTGPNASGKVGHNSEAALAAPSPQRYTDTAPSFQHSPSTLSKLHSSRSWRKWEGRRRATVVMVTATEVGPAWRALLTCSSTDAAIGAHRASFVPAERATIGMVDAIFTRLHSREAVRCGLDTGDAGFACPCRR